VRGFSSPGSGQEIVHCPVPRRSQRCIRHAALGSQAEASVNGLVPGITKRWSSGCSESDPVVRECVNLVVAWLRNVRRSRWVQALVRTSVPTDCASGSVGRTKLSGFRAGGGAGVAPARRSNSQGDRASVVFPRKDRRARGASKTGTGATALTDAGMAHPLDCPTRSGRRHDWSLVRVDDQERLFPVFASSRTD